MAYNRDQTPPTLHDMDCNTWLSLCRDAHLIGSNDQGELTDGTAREIFGKVWHARHCCARPAMVALLRRWGPRLRGGRWCQIQGGRVKKPGRLPGQKQKQPSQRWMRDENLAKKKGCKSTISINQFIECLRLVRPFAHSRRPSFCRS